MEDVTRRDLAGLLGAVAAGMALSAPAQAATGADSLDALAKAKGFTGFGSSAGGGASSASRQPGMTMVSASASSSGAYGACTVMPPAARMVPGSMAQTAKSYQSTPSSGRSSANNSTVQPNSKVHRRS